MFIWCWCCFYACSSLWCPLRWGLIDRFLPCCENVLNKSDPREHCLVVEYKMFPIVWQGTGLQPLGVFLFIDFLTFLVFLLGVSKAWLDYATTDLTC